MTGVPPIRGAFRSDVRARAAYAEAAGIHRIVPSAVAQPVDTADAVALVRWAVATRTSLVPRGAGSAMGGGSVGEGVVVDLTLLDDREVEVLADERRAVTAPGVTLLELNTLAADAGLRLPPDPSSGRWATLGGMLATNAAGPRTVRYGSVRPWVDALTLIDGRGELLTLQRGAPAPAAGPLARLPALLAAERTRITSRFPATRKNSAGYALDACLESGDLLDLVIGAEGTLGLVTRITWRLDPVPGGSASLAATLPTLELLAPAVEALQAVRPSSVELLDRTFLELVHTWRPDRLDPALAGADALLIVEVERPHQDEALDAAREAIAALAALGVGATLAADARALERLWALRHAASPILASLPEQRRSLQVIEDGCVPIPRLGDYIRAVRAAAERQGVTAVLFGHAGDGHLHVNLLPDLGRPGWQEALAAILGEVSETVIRLGGTPAGEHGDGRLRAGLLEALYGPELLALFRAVKAAFDPFGIMNPGVILPAAGARPLAHLKVGPDAAPLPADIAHALREIERTGGYGRSRLDVADG